MWVLKQPTLCRGQRLSTADHKEKDAKNASKDRPNHAQNRMVALATDLNSPIMYVSLNKSSHTYHTHTFTRRNKGDTVVYARETNLTYHVIVVRFRN
jgi:hypothetical protein